MRAEKVCQTANQMVFGEKSDWDGEKTTQIGEKTTQIGEKTQEVGENHHWASYWSSIGKRISEIHTQKRQIFLKKHKGICR